MKRSSYVVGVVLALVGGAASTLAQNAPVVPPQPTVPEIFTLQGEFVRLAYNNEGFVTLGYRTANDEVGNEWMLLDVGMTLLNGAKAYTLKPTALTVTTPDGKTIPLATQKEFIEAGYLKALNRRAQVSKDSVNYFPTKANTPCALRFFAPPGTVVYDQVELDEQRACFGKLYFHIPGGIQIGQHWLNVQFASSVVQVPFRILTEAEEKQLRKQWKELKKQHEALLKGE